MLSKWDNEFLFQISIPILTGSDHSEFSHMSVELRKSRCNNWHSRVVLEVPGYGSALIPSILMLIVVFQEPFDFPLSVSLNCCVIFIHASSGWRTTGPLGAQFHRNIISLHCPPPVQKGHRTLPSTFFLVAPSIDNINASSWTEYELG